MVFTSFMLLNHPTKSYSFYRQTNAYLTFFELQIIIFGITKMKQKCDILKSYNKKCSLIMNHPKNEKSCV